MAKKSYNEKLHVSNGLPKVEDISSNPNAVQKLGGNRMLIAAPLDYDAVMKRIPCGQVTTAADIRTFLAYKYDADVTCPLTAGIFINIVAHASQERENEGKGELTPYWRTLKKDGELNEKYPGGIDQQRMLLETEGHMIEKRGSRYFVKGYQDRLFQL